MEVGLAEAEERGNAFFLGLLEKQHVRMKGLFDRQVVSPPLRYHPSLYPNQDTQAEFLKEIGETNLTSKKRNGVVPFIKVFPLFGY